MLESYVVDDGADEFWSAVSRLGRHRLPTLAGLDPYADTALRGEAVERLVRELKGSDLARLCGAEREVTQRLVAWGVRCREDRNLYLAFSGD
ncbi:hypothetical protein [Streptomyces sp. CB03238]|uniref:hypothetical protein n=1 Tax=Streptomyces sp. CB03238 TaxID=1907777 RepID=UPI00117CE0E4|nr:hypothetical protein [Streptomyces sp. CB03238]